MNVKWTLAMSLLTFKFWSELENGSHVVYIIVNMLCCACLRPLKGVSASNFPIFFFLSVFFSFFFETKIRTRPECLNNLQPLTAAIVQAIKLA